MDIAPLGGFHIAGQYDRCMTGSLSNGNLKDIFSAEIMNRFLAEPEFGTYLKSSHFFSDSSSIELGDSAELTGSGGVAASAGEEGACGFALFCGSVDGGTGF